MLKVVRSMRELPFRQLMEVYTETNTATARRHYAEETLVRGVAMAEDTFYYDLRCGFFTIPGAVYCLWMEDEICVSAVRLEPWRDGMLLTALETAPGHRNRGYACSLLQAVQGFLRRQGNVRLYAHIHNRNAVSIHTHEKCGFRKLSDTAAYLDGSVDSRGATYLYEE